MLRPGPAENENIIKENKDAPPKEWLQHCVHQRLEGRRSVREAEWHHKELKVPVMSSECGLGDVIRMHTNLVIPAAQVELGEEDCTLELVQQFFDNGYGELVAHRLVVQGAVVHTESPGAIAFAHQQDRRGEGRRALSDDALRQHRLALGFNLIFQQLGVAVRTHCHRWGSWKEMNLVVERARRRKTLGFGKQISKLIK